VTDFTELPGFRNKSIVAVDQNAKHPAFIRKASKTSSLKLLEQFFGSHLEISAPQCSTF
jgi:hypothetical protein